MLERVIENWLDKASEKSFQVPFCFMLASEGHTILHLTRHAAMEYGKDIIAIDPEGNVCAYQLKGAPGSRIGLSKYRSEILPQLLTLTTVPVMHPSITDPSKPHKSYFVTNGFLEEEVAIAIDSTNKANVARGLPQQVVHTITRGELIEKAKKIKMELLPSDLTDFNLFLELYLEEGAGRVNKVKVSRLLDTLYRNEELKAKDRKELIPSSAVIVSLITSNHSNLNNHIALVEAWTLYISYTYRFIEINKIEPKYYKQEIAIAFDTILHELDELFDEVIAEPIALKPFGPGENLVLNAKLTWIMGYISFLGIYHKKTGNAERTKKILDFLQRYPRIFEAYGESAFAPLLNYYWLKRITDATVGPLSILQLLLNTIINILDSRDTEQSYFLADPYHDIEACLKERFNKKKKIKGSKYESYYADSIIQLIARENHKQYLKMQWPSFSKLHLKVFRFNSPSDYYTWNNTKGDEVTILQNPTQVWSQLYEKSKNYQEEALPEMIRKDPSFIPLFMLVYPHRINSDLVKFFESWVRKYETIDKKII